jgi:hypothetical protein
MRLYGAIQKVEAQDDGTVRVHGIASSEAVDDQGEIVRADAIRAAIPDYMHFPALREMHQLSAAGTTLEAEVCDDGTTRIVAHVVDPVAVAKVKNRVYRGFSIGGRVTQRDPRDPKTITALVLNEISLVDRPANPEAIFDCWKAAVVGDASSPESTDAPMLPPEPSLSREPFNSPIQIWACGAPDHRHLAKAEALTCLQKRNAGSGTLNAAASATPAKKAADEAAVSPADETKDPPQWNTTNDKIPYADPGYQPDRRKRYPIDTERHIRAAWSYINKPINADKYTADQLRQIKAAIIAAWKAKIDKDGPPSAKDHEKITAELCDFPTAAVNEGTNELLGGTTDSSPQRVSEISEAPNYVIDVPPMLRVAALALKGKSKMRKLAGLLAKADDSESDQALMDMAHRCLSELTDGACCGMSIEMAPGHSATTLQHLQAAHDHLVAAGARCDSADMAGTASPIEVSQAEFERVGAKITPEAQFTKLPTNRQDDKEAIGKVLGQIMPMLERLTTRVDEIARTPLPPLTIAKGTVSVAKQHDRGGEAELSAEAVAAALAKMSKEEQTLALIKASYANPIRAFGASGDER